MERITAEGSLSKKEKTKKVRTLKGEAVFWGIGGERERVPIVRGLKKFFAKETFNKRNEKSQGGGGGG